MARTKKDINLKKNPFMAGHYLVRFTNEKALNIFNRTNPEFSHKIKAAYLDEWFPMTIQSYEWLESNPAFKEFTFSLSA